MNYLLIFQLHHGSPNIFLVREPDAETVKMIEAAGRNHAVGEELEKLCFNGDRDQFVYNPDGIEVQNIRIERI